MSTKYRLPNSDINRVVFFDGYCGLCNRTVDFIHKKDRSKKFYFAPLQGSTAKQILNIKDINTLDTVWYYKNNQLYQQSDAIIEICRDLSGIYRAFVLAKIIPKWVRDPIYRFIAVRRNRFFKRRETCRLPQPNESQFLE